jgi:hypothetical protein
VIFFPLGLRIRPRGETKVRMGLRDVPSATTPRHFYNASSYFYILGFLKKKRGV